MAKKILYGMISLLCLVLVGLSEFVIAGFDTRIFYSASYWYSLIASTIASALILYSTATNDIDNYKVKDEQVLKLKSELDNQVNNNVENDFEKFLVEENQKRKIYAWKQKVSNKINRIERFARVKDIELYYSNEEELKKDNKYCQKRAKLEHLMSDEYIYTHLYYLRVKYPKLKRYEITTGCRQKDEEYQLTTKPHLRVLVDNLPRLAMSFGLILFASSFAPDIKEFQWATIITFTIKLISLCLNFMNGKGYALYFKDEVMIPDLRYRIDKIIAYMTWKVNLLKYKTGGVKNE
jgi:hypothetical protein